MNMIEIEHVRTFSAPLVALWYGVYVVVGFYTLIKAFIWVVDNTRSVIQEAVVVTSYMVILIVFAIGLILIPAGTNIDQLHVAQYGVTSMQLSGKQYLLVTDCTPPAVYYAVAATTLSDKDIHVIHISRQTIFGLVHYKIQADVQELLTEGPTRLSM